MDDFSSIPTSTATIITKLNTQIDLEALFILLPITNIFLPPPRKSCKKYKIKSFGQPGAILSLQLKDVVRGVVVNANNKFFKNQITCIISNKTKNINMKIFSDKIHLTGCKFDTEDMTKETVGYLIQNMKTINDTLVYMNGFVEDPIELARKEKSRDETLGYLYNCILESMNTGLDYPNAVKNIQLTGNELIDTRIYNFAYELISSLETIDQCVSFLEWLTTIPRIYTDEPYVTDIDVIMVNITFSLGYEIDRKKFREEINKCSKFHAIFEKTSKLGTIVRWYYHDPNEKKKRKQLKKHTFTVFKTGNVNQSGRNRKMMEPIYYEFLAAANLIKDKVKLEKIIPEVPVQQEIIGNAYFNICSENTNQQQLTFPNQQQLTFPNQQQSETHFNETTENDTLNKDIPTLSNIASYQFPNGNSLFNDSYLLQINQGHILNQDKNSLLTSSNKFNINKNIEDITQQLLNTKVKSSFITSNGKLNILGKNNNSLLSQLTGDNKLYNGLLSVKNPKSLLSLASGNSDNYEVKPNQSITVKNECNIEYTQHQENDIKSEPITIRQKHPKNISNQ
jgi:hypothetical protein